MTVLTTMIGLVPILWTTGTGADVMKRIAAPMVGGLVTSFLLELTVYPAIFALWKGRRCAGRRGPSRCRNWRDNRRHRRRIAPRSRDLGERNKI